MPPYRTEQVCHPPRAPRCIVVARQRPTRFADSALRDCDVLIHEATFTEDVLAKVGPATKHSTRRKLLKQRKRHNCRIWY